jgi:hypothetical protein
MGLYQIPVHKSVAQMSNTPDAALVYNLGFIMAMPKDPFSACRQVKLAAKGENWSH